MFTKIRAVLVGTLRRARARQALRWVLRSSAGAQGIENWGRSLSDPTGYYLDCVRYFHTPALPELLRRHRKYFQESRRGFGEDAFHVMWWMLFRELRPARFLEIGVYRGQTLSLACLLQRELGIKGSVTGISPFTSSGDSVSQYREEVDYFANTLENFARFGLPKPELVRAFSTDPDARERVAAVVWDAIYIDGNHDYEVARADWDLCAVHVRPGGVIVLDDAALDTDYHPPAFATAGHPGPSQLAREVNLASFREMLRVGHNRVFQRIA
jgi:hypothetical protein